MAQGALFHAELLQRGADAIQAQFEKDECPAAQAHHSNYGAKIKYSAKEDTPPAVGNEENIFIQKVMGTFHYYAKPVDTTMLVALSVIAAEQSRPTE